jgi:hypothetical protein
MGITLEAFYKELDEADARTAADTTPLAVAARYDRTSGRIVVDLSNDTTFIFPARYGQGLAEATEDELAEVEIWPTGTGLHWERLDADLGIKSLLNGLFGSKAWMRQLQAERGRKGGLARSPAKSAAARANGKKGGRPRKQTSG